jgi:hypothetical protein
MDLIPPTIMNVANAFLVCPWSRWNWCLLVTPQQIRPSYHRTLGSRRPCPRSRRLWNCRSQRQGPCSLRLDRRLASPRLHSCLRLHHRPCYICLSFGTLLNPHKVQDHQHRAYRLQRVRHLQLHCHALPAEPHSLELGGHDRLVLGRLLHCLLRLRLLPHP